MKKFASILLALCMCLSAFAMLTACEEEHTHTYKTEWAKDATNHWHACEGEGCTEVADKAEHTWNAGEITTAATKEAAGVKTFTCTVCAQTKTESVAYVVKTTVTADEWAAAFNLGENWTMTASVTMTVGEVAAEMSMAIKRDANKFYLVETEMDPSSTEPDVDESYAEIVDNVWYNYYQDSETKIYEKRANADPADECVKDLTENFFPEFLTDFTQYQYDEAKKAYVAASIAQDEEEDMQVTNVEMKFEDGKLVSCVYTIASPMGNDQVISVPYTMVITYGDAAVTLPTVG